MPAGATRPISSSWRARYHYFTTLCHIVPVVILTPSHLIPLLYYAVLGGASPSLLLIGVPGPRSAHPATLSICGAGAEGTGHHFITALMMRLSELMPMSLTQEQMFQSLWWNPDDNDPSVFWGAMESFMEW